MSGNSFFESKENTSTNEGQTKIDKKKEKNEMSSTRFWFGSTQTLIRNENI